MKPERASHLLALLAKLEAAAADGRLTLGEIFEAFEASDHWILILLFCLPFLQPIPLVGLSTPLGLMIAVSAVLWGIGRAPWLPKFLHSRGFSKEAVTHVIRVGRKIAGWATHWLKPRGSVLLNSPFSHWLSVGLVVGNAMILALPLPIPFSNTVPAIPIILQALGRLEKDGVFVVLSYVFTGLCIVFCGGIILGADNGLDWLRNAF